MEKPFAKVPAEFIRGEDMVAVKALEDAEDTVELAARDKTGTIIKHYQTVRLRKGETYLVPAWQAENLVKNLKLAETVAT